MAEKAVKELGRKKMSNKNLHTLFLLWRINPEE